DVNRVEVDPGTGATHPYFVIEGKCPMLDDFTSLCTMYPDWPYTCATYPFLLLPDGTLMVHRECDGFGHGEVVDEKLMKRKILHERKRAGMVVQDG
ncbi:MAG: YkgJ family cysteine cluster protein, partial [Thermoplasmatota archaeon]